MSYRVNREEKLSDDAQNNTAVASAGSDDRYGNITGETASCNSQRNATRDQQVVKSTTTTKVVQLAEEVILVAGVMVGYRTYDQKV